ncbi:hypothetical protein KJA13_00330 [Patescibacteria group bacterium]|nr:hypothetical protein [Patescibacteria group bacterium]
MISKQTNTIRILVVACLILCCLYLIGVVRREARALNLRNVTDSLILSIEFTTEPGMDYIQAKADYVEILYKYVRHMENRHIPLLFFFSRSNIAGDLKRVVRDLEKADELNAREAIEKASEAIAEFFTKTKPFTDESIITFESEVISEEIQTAIKDSLQEAHEKAETCANDSNVANFEALYRANRKAIVYLYLARFEYQEIVDEEKLRTFRTDLNATCYRNEALQDSDTVEISEEECSRLTVYYGSELRRLGILYAIIDNNIQQAYDLLQTEMAARKAIPDI